MSGGVFGGEVIVCRSLYVNMYGDHKLARQITSNFAPALVRAKYARETAVTEQKHKLFYFYGLEDIGAAQTAAAESARSIIVRARLRSMPTYEALRSLE